MSISYETDECLYCNQYIATSFGLCILCNIETLKQYCIKCKENKILMKSGLCLICDIQTQKSTCIQCNKLDILINKLCYMCFIKSPEMNTQIN